VCTANAVESLNARFRDAVGLRTRVPNELAALKALYLVRTERRSNRSNPTGEGQWLEDDPQRREHPLRRSGHGCQLTMVITPADTNNRTVPALTKRVPGGWKARSAGGGHGEGPVRCQRLGIVCP
jgi:hypothetical protein